MQQTAVSQRAQGGSAMNSEDLMEPGLAMSPQLASCVLLTRIYTAATHEGRYDLEVIAAFKPSAKSSPQCAISVCSSIQRILLISLTRSHNT